MSSTTKKPTFKIECIRNDSKMRMEIVLTCTEFTWNCPLIQQPDFGNVIIRYTPGHNIAETKSLKFYLQRYRYHNAYNEELSNRILLDFIYFVKPIGVEVRLEQNSRGGIANTSTVRWSLEDKNDVATWDTLKYKPKNDFRGGWGMVK